MRIARPFKSEENKMEYRRLGSAGIKVSVLSLGSWVTYGPQVDVDASAAMLKLAYDNGINFFDNAETYSAGESEKIMGSALRRLSLRRGSYLVSTKLFWGLGEGPNEKNTLNRKYLLEAVEGSLERLGMDHVDLIFCHRPDPETPMEETVRAMSDIVSSGKAFYWGTSEWSAEQIREAWDIADRRNLHRPQMEQPQYNMLNRNKVEKEFARLYDGIGLGLTTFSPLASGLLSGKYKNGVPEGSRFALPGYEWLKKRYFHDDIPAVVARLEPIAAELGCTMSQLGLAWVARNPRVSTVITGASKVEQLKENLGALPVMKKLTPEVLARIDETLRPIIQ
jgi:voltage-dependent potassium channel beta subunit